MAIVKGTQVAFVVLYKATTEEVSKGWWTIILATEKDEVALTPAIDMGS